MEDYLKIGQHGCDYNETIVEVIEIGTLGTILQKLQQLTSIEIVNTEIEMQKDIGPIDFTKKFYLTKTIEDNDCVPVKKGEYLIYPYEYDYANYYGIASFEDFEK